MKIKTIERLCREAMEEWIASLPTELQQPAMEDAFLTGGAIASLFLGERVNDWDVYFRTTTDRPGRRRALRPALQGLRAGRPEGRSQDPPHRRARGWRTRDCPRPERRRGERHVR